MSRLEELREKTFGFVWGSETLTTARWTSDSRDSSSKSPASSMFKSNVGWIVESSSLAAARAAQREVVSSQDPGSCRLAACNLDFIATEHVAVAVPVPTQLQHMSEELKLI